MADATNTPAAPGAQAPGDGSERANNKILVKMLDRLFASLVNGPGLNCRPHNSRQRIDLTQLAKLGDVSPDAVLVRLLGKPRKAAVKARVPQPRRRAERNYSDEAATGEDAAAAAAERAWAEQQAVLQKLHVIAEDARTYEQDTGVHVLNVGFPLLSLPPGAFGGAAGVTRRILAPVAFIPVTLTTKRGSVAAVEIACRGQGVDLVVPNNALLAWLEQQTGAAGARAREAGGEVFADERGDDPGREVWDLVRHVCRLLDIPPPRPFDQDIAAPAPSAPSAPDGAGASSDGRAGAADDEVIDVIEEQTAMVLSSEAPAGGAGPDGGPGGGRATQPLTLRPAPRADETPDEPAVLFSAVVGLFPTSNQGLLRDMQEMVKGESLDGPVESFIRLGVSLDVPPEMSGAMPDAPKEPVRQRPRAFDEERMVAPADPCQSRAVRLARESRGLVIHGPPGTGKSQTITNIIGDHLSRGQRVLLVCEKRTALDVVANRLEHMGLDRLVAIVHDPQRDQRELYRRLRDQLEMLAESQTDARSEAKLQKVNDELQRLHGELTAYRAALVTPDPQTGASFHDLVGQWLATPADSGSAGVSAWAGGPGLSGPALKDLASTRLVHLDAQADAVREIFQRAAEVDLAENPWRDCAGVSLADVLSRPADWYRSTAAQWQEASAVADATADPGTPPFAPAPNDLAAQAEARVAFAKAFDGLLDVIAPEALQRWADRDLPSIQAVRAKLSEAGGYIQAIKAGPLDGELLASLLASRAGAGRKLPTLTEMGEYRDLVQRYGDAYSTWSVWVARVRQGAPNASLPTIARWIDADEKTFDAAHKTLKAAEPLAGQAAAAPLDPELLAQYRRQPFDMTRLLAWQAALDTYLPKSRGLFSFLHGGKKRAAAPATEFFGLAVGPDTAQRVRDFLAGLRARLELRYALQKAVGSGALPQLPDDDELLATFNDHYATVQAAADLQRPKAAPGARPLAGPTPNVNTVTDETDLVHRLIGPELNEVTPLFAEYGLFPNPENTTRVKAFLQALTVRLLLQDFHHRLLGGAAPEILMGDEELEGTIRVHSALLDLIIKASREPLLSGLSEPLRRAMSEPETQSPLFIEGLYKSPARAKAVGVLERELAETNLFTPQFLAEVSATLRNGGSFTDAGRGLAERIDTLEGVVRVREGVARLEFGMKQAVQALLEQSAAADEAWAVLRKAVLTAEITRRLRLDPLLQNVDGKRVATSFNRYRELDERKRDLVRDQIFDQWVTQQKERLVVDTGTRLNALGAELKRRLTLRGERAMRLRQVVAVGRKTPGGDPLFDLCPVWMVSPETAAQVFPREPVFDVVVFDEASQCRLEEALPVLTRGGRLVIAGDPKQLPPTRFFESAVSQSDNEQIETDQQLFEMQQGEVEDLLGAALGLDIQQCYLDVHYRSRNADLIAFSNVHFYGSRLQPIPGHPSRLPPHAPIRLHRVAGVYQNRENEAEARAVCDLVAELLSQKDPPSIGVACFNLQQRDLIVDKLDERAAGDERFAKRLEKARERTGPGSFEGLFVKNLENVQGDERDHIIISTTYGPDKAGRFYRRFGPLGMSGGGRRLNVLVTRARDEVHLVTSIPREAYRSLPELEPGQTRGGAWLLFAYLQFAEQLQRDYGAEVADESQPDTAQDADPAPSPHALARPLTAATPLAVSHLEPHADGNGEVAPADALPDALPVQRRSDPPADPDEPEDATEPSAPVRVRPTRTPSPFVQSLAQRLADAHGVRSDVYWGNDGFCVDVALRDPADPARMTVGVLCDAARFTAAEDPVEWDVFRTAVLEKQGWELHRVWTPHFFRDPEGATRTLLRAAGQSVARQGVEGTR